MGFGPMENNGENSIGRDNDFIDALPPTAPWRRSFFCFKTIIASTRLLLFLIRRRARGRPGVRADVLSRSGAAPDQEKASSGKRSTIRSASQSS